jgi:hypothetical protein
MFLKPFRKRNHWVPVLLALALLFSASSSLAMSFQMNDMDNKECTTPVTCEMCCMVYLPAPIKFDQENSFTPVEPSLIIAFPELRSFSIYHPPK